MELAARDLRIGSDQSVALVTKPPERWDELLDCGLPLLISHKALDWTALGAQLWESGLSPSQTVRLVEANGQVKAVELKEKSLLPAPESQRWSLAIGWTHPDEGWRARLPLFGRHYIVTRAKDQGQGLVEQLRELGATVTHLPTIEFTEPDDLGPWQSAVSRLHDFEWVVFTSPNGVRFFMERLGRSERDLRALAGATLACIGPSTARTLREFGLKADLVPPEYVAESLLEELSSRLAGGRILLPRAQVARDVLPQGLKEAGADVLVAPVYKTVKPELQFEDLPRDARVLFTSSSTAKNWREAAPDAAYPCFCIGPVTAATAKECGIEVLGIGREFTIEGLLATVLRLDSSSAERVE